MSVEKFTSQQRWVLTLTAAASFVAVMDGMVVTTALDAIRRDLSAPLSELHWTMTAYSLSFAALLMAGAALGDRFGRRSMFILGLAAFAIASAGCAAASSIEWLIAGRAVQGAASALLVPVAMTLLGTAVTPAQRPRAMGLFSSLTGLAVLSGPILGGVLVDALGWRWVFWINLPLCAAIALVAALRLARNDRLAAQIDWFGVALLTTVMTSVVWGLSEANAQGRSGATVVSAFTVGAAAALGFFAWQRRGAHPLIPGRLLASAPFKAGNIACLLMFMSMMGTLLFMAQFFSIVQQASASGAGERMLPWTLALFVAAPAGGIAAGRFGERGPAVAGLLLQGAALLWMSLLCDANSGYGAWIAPLVLAGAGVATAMPAVQSAVLGSVAPADMGKASGIYNTMRQLGWACGAAAAVAVFGAFGNLARAETMAAGYSAVLLMTAALSAAAALVASRLPSAASSASAAAGPANPPAASDLGKAVETV
ncbi:MFS transporter [Bradyrhizobium sp. USDA 4486]